ncbi:uncharacterized protein F5891DRAFT_976510 [Suillus fuscotomentosus]|uniref:Uncharacterized protein n=1 Tax=Suillus fuscotomentosus TaxID=1912939 RepID=A0AAD4EF55_9AGAM|nr:uncharacterized protein F5891DRAFT_976510 [Suillus fuscotomentosus]KAG1904922.1 hypothetical protein F5891DRAFT_976510 [Suillus fuscotomentosus]
MASLTTSIRIGMSNGRHNSASVAGMAAMVVSFRAVMIMMMMVASVDLLPEDQELCPGIRNFSKDNVLINFRVEVFYSTGIRIERRGVSYCGEAGLAQPYARANLHMGPPFTKASCQPVCLIRRYHSTGMRAI